MRVARALCGDRIEGETLAQIVGVIKLSTRVPTLRILK